MGTDTSAVTRQVFELVARCLDEHRTSFATVCVGKRSFSLYPTPAPAGSSISVFPVPTAA